MLASVYSLGGIPLCSALLKKLRMVFVYWLSVLGLEA